MGNSKKIIINDKNKFTVDTYKQHLIKKLDGYKCDFNWDFSAPRGGKPKHKSYIALQDVLKILATLK